MTRKEINKKYPKRNGYYFVYGHKGEELRLPAVTEILKMLNKPQLMSWAARESSKIALDDPSLSLEEVLGKFYGISRKAAERGRRIHSLFQAILHQTDNFDTSKILKEDRPYAEGIINFQKEYNVKCIHNEYLAINLELGYAGTVDEVIKTNNKIWILDLKTGKGVYPDHALQLEAYKQALITQGINVEKTMVLHVPGDRTFSLIEMQGDIEVFLALKKVWEWNQK